MPRLFLIESNLPSSFTSTREVPTSHSPGRPRSTRVFDYLVTRARSSWTGNFSRGQFLPIDVPSLLKYENLKLGLG